MAEGYPIPLLPIGHKALLAH
jgi:NDP-sugar pyrophosphorylase family protein